MEPRRTILKTLAAALFGVPAANAQATRSNVKVAGRSRLPAPFDGKEANLIEVTIPPGGGSPPHQHAGFVLGYVLEGEFRFAINGEPAKVLKAGETFYEPPGAHHTVSASAIPDKPVRILAIIIAESGAELTKPV
jgi:quercetin dioxygenase-like cupin family protein